MNNLARKFLAAVVLVSVLPALAWYRLQRLAFGRLAAFQWASERSACWPGALGVVRRRALYGRLLSQTGTKVVICFGTVLSRDTAELGDRVFVGRYCSLGDVRIGNDAMLADAVAIPSGGRQHGTNRTDVPMRDQPGEFQVIRIGDDCWIGSGAVILANVASHCIVAAGSVVTRPTSAYEIVAGVPARAIGSRLDGKQPPPS